MVELIIEGNPVDLESKGNNIKYTKQISDIFDIASVSSSFTNAFTIRKTPNNTQTLKGLGIVGDTSDIPYVKTNATLKNHGFDLVREGLLNITETNENYKVSVINGIIELFKAMENKTIGADLDLSNFNHEKNIQTVINSISNNYYKYIVADYGGNIMINQGVIVTNASINIDYLTPSFSVVKLLELIFSTFGFQVNFAGINNFIEGLFITYPKPPETVITDAVQSANLIKGNYVAPYVFQNAQYALNPAFANWDSGSVINEGTLSNNAYNVPLSSIYRLNIKIKGYALYKGVNLSFSQYIPFTVSIEVDNVPLLQFQSDPYQLLERELTLFINAGAKIRVRCFVTVLQYGNGIGAFKLKEFHVNSTILDIDRINQGNISLSNAMKSFKITDFLKEIIWRTGSTPIINDNNIVEFIPIESRLNKDNAIDWSDKFVERGSEKYVKNSYAQRNTFNMKYNSEGADSSNGVLRVGNKNIDAEKVLAQSQLYAPETFTSIITTRDSNTETQVPVFTMWSKSPKENQDGSLAIEYKALDNRYFFLRFDSVLGNYRFNSSVILGSAQNVSNILIANTANTLFSDLIPLSYSQYEKIFNQFKAHDIDLKLGLKDFLMLDLTKIYYFAQEARYYMINKVSFQEGELSKAECVAVVPYTEEIINITSIQITGTARNFAIYFNYSGFTTNFLVLEYMHNNTFWVQQQIASVSPQIFTILTESGNYKIRIRNGQTVSNIAPLNFL